MKSLKDIKDEDFHFQPFGQKPDYLFDVYSSESGMEFPEKDIAALLLTYLPPALLFVGTVGNILTAIILCRMFQKILPTCLYVFVIEIVDLFVLYIRCGNSWLKQLAAINIRDRAMLSSKSVCKIYPFVADFVLHLTTWMLVAAAIETALVIMRPPRLMRICRLERARAVVLLIVVLLVCLNAHCFWTYALIKVEKTNLEELVCTNMRSGNQHSEEFRKIVWPVLDLLIGELFPYFTIFACSVIILTKRIRKKEHMRQLENTWKAYSLDADTGRQLHTAFLCLFFLHLLLLLPKLFCNMFLFFLDPSILGLVKFTMVLESKTILARAVSELLLYVFASCKFFVFLAASRTFRVELWTLFRCKFCGRDEVRTTAVMGAANNLDVHHRTPTATRQPLLDKNDTRPVDDSLARKQFSMTSV